MALLPQGGSQCTLWARPDAWDQLLPTAGNVLPQLAIPTSPTVLGMPGFHQVVDVAFDAAGITSLASSNGLVLGARMVLTRFVRGERRDPRREVPLAETPTAAQPPAGQPTPPVVAMANEQRARLEAAIAELPPDYRQVLAHARLEHLPRAEIAERLGRSDASVRSLLTRALKALGERLGDGGPSAG